ncbi:hypothetical protein F0562_006531 [Nyssa sinensis]|uniref:Uncharacterized protein n=1 Tax=Nyssa sinensis TaxID=561372 RepID=A0A5J5APS2_9ASTE|nr:hypothetical protein F0562_006531 [Nyssa sinensis]
MVVVVVVMMTMMMLCIFQDKWSLSLSHIVFRGSEDVTGGILQRLSKCDKEIKDLMMMYAECQSQHRKLIEGETKQRRRARLNHLKTSAQMS